MTDYAQFASRLVAKTTQPLFFDELTPLVGSLFADVGPIPQSGDASAALREVAHALPLARDPFHVGRLMLFAGFLVERGAPAELVGAKLVERLGPLLSAASLAASRDRDEQDVMKLARAIVDTHPDAASAIVVLEPALAGAMGILSRDREALRLARRDTSLVPTARSLAGNVIVAHFLAELLESSDQTRIHVIHPRLRRGAVVIADGVRNGFHFFALLDDLLIGPDGRGLVGGTPLPREDAELARGLRPLEGERTMQARFDYFNWSAWARGGFVEDAPTRWVWGELRLSSIPELHGERLVLVDTPRYVRSWDARLAIAVHPAQGSNVTRERDLTTEEVDRWLAVAESAPGDARARLRYAGVRFG